MICNNSICRMKELLEEGESCQELLNDEIQELQEELTCRRAELVCDGRPRVELSPHGNERCQQQLDCDVCRRG